MRSISAGFLVALAIGAASCASRQPEAVDTELPAFAIADCSTDPSSSCVLSNGAVPIAFFSDTGTSGVSLPIASRLDASFAQPAGPSSLRYLAIGLEWNPPATEPAPPPELDVVIDGLPLQAIAPVNGATRVEIDMLSATVNPGAKLHLFAKSDDFVILYVEGRWDNL